MKYPISPYLHCKQMTKFYAKFYLHVKHPVLNMCLHQLLKTDIVFIHVTNLVYFMKNMKNPSRLLLLLLLLFHLNVHVFSDPAIPDEIALRNELVNNGCWPLDQRHSAIRPASNFNQPVLVTVWPIFDRIVDISDTDEQLSFVANFRFNWTIECANWENDTKWSHIDFLIIPTSEMWIPKISHINGLNDYFLDQSKLSISEIWIKPNGHVIWWACGLFVNQCSFNFQKFPFDTQVCGITMECWYFPTQVRLRISNATIIQPSNDGTNDFFFLNKSEAVYGYEENNIYSNDFFSDRVVYKFTLKRDSSYYTCVIIIPTLALMILQNLAFFLPLSMERCSFLVSILLAISLIQAIVDANIPHVAQRVVISYLLLGFTIMATCATIYSIMALFIITLSKQLKKKRIFNGKMKYTVFADLCCFTLFSMSDIIFLLVVFKQLLE